MQQMKSLKDRLTPEQLELIEIHSRKYTYTNKELWTALEENTYVIDLTVYQAHRLCAILGKELKDIYKIFKA